MVDASDVSIHGAAGAAMFGIYLGVYVVYVVYVVCVVLSGKVTEPSFLKVQFLLFVVNLIPSVPKTLGL